MTITDKPISDDAFKGGFGNYSENQRRAATLRERKACAALVRSISLLGFGRERITDILETIAKNIEARP